MKNKSLFEYCLRLGDTSLILGQRLSEWCGLGPILEEDIAMSNIALDLLGQSRIILTYAGEVEGKKRDEDALAFLRDERDYRNLLIVEQPNGDYGQTILRQFLYSAYAFFFYSELKNSKDKTISAFAEKSLKEVTYHLRHSSGMVIRLGDGTEESHQRMMNAIDELWMFTGDMFEMDEIDAELISAGIAVDMKKMFQLWENKVKEVFKEATLEVPQNVFMQHGSRKGIHT
ncbi:MAG: phenylacetate-CoA oxygenase subunit PaaC, partial [Bacteroidia bacterium]|nr:phenylacetate-CoA oxygenase subunit PaaC [Bacteroidia bacterium]